MKIRHIRAIKNTVDKFYEILGCTQYYKNALRAFEEYGDDVKVTYSSEECFDVDVGLMNFTIKSTPDGKYKIDKYATYYNCEVSQPIELEE